MSELAICGGKPVRTKGSPDWPIYGEAEERKLIEVLRSGQWGIGGSEVVKFEKRFAEYQGAKYGVAVVNGTVALKIALLAAGIKAGDEVIVPPFTFLATATSVVEANATPIFADIQAETLNIDPKAVEAAITDRTKVIIPVHLGGLPVDMDAIMDIAGRHDLIVIEDAAHSHGGEYKGKRLGSIGHMGCFSFQSSKNLNSGEGGIIISSDEELATKCWSIQNCGRARGGEWYEHHTISGNYRLGQFQAGILNCQMDRLDEQTTLRDANGLRLSERMAKVPGISPQVRTADCTRHSYHVLGFLYDSAPYDGVPRELYIKALQAEGVPASVGYTLPLYRQPLFQNAEFGPYTGYRSARPDMDFSKVSCPACEKVCESQVAWIYQSAFLGTAEDMDEMACAFEKLYENRDELAKFAAEEAKKSK